MAPKKKEKKNASKNEKKETEVNKEVKKKSNFVVTQLLISALGIVLSISCYYFYTSFLYTPSLPNFDMDVSWGPNKQDTSVRPFRITFTDSMQENLRRKFEAYRRATRIKSLNESSAYGMNADVTGQIFGDWQFKYKYSQRERFLNKYNHYKTNIQGLDIHYMRVVPENVENVQVYPLLLLHGWPSSVRDFYDMIPILTNVRAGHNFVFEVIAPSLPGFAYSQAPVKPGLTTYQIAIIMRNLMERIGHQQFYVHGGDLGHTIGSHMATIFPNQVLGFHTTTPVNLSKLAQLALVLGSICPSLVANDLADKIYPISDKLQYYIEELGYLHLQSTKPDTLGIALQDSPLGLAVYIIEKYLLFTNPAHKEAFTGSFTPFNSTDLLDNVLLYWSTGSITTSLRLYKETVSNYNMEETLARIPTKVPTWGMRTKHDLMHQPDFILRWKYSNLLGITNLDSGGHFIAFENPEEVAKDLYRAVRRFLKRK